MQLFIKEIRCCSSLIDTGRKLSICSNVTLHSTLFSVRCDSSDLEFIKEWRVTILSKKCFENNSTNSLAVYPDGKIFCCTSLDNFLIVL